MVSAGRRVPRRLLASGVVLAGVGGMLCLLALLGVGGPDSRGRFAQGWLWGAVFVWSVTLGCLFFVALHHLTHAVWSVAVRRVAEMLAAGMPLAGLLFVPVLLMAWRQEAFGLFAWLDPVSAGDELIHAKRAYLNLPSFAGRTVLFFVLWIGFARHFVGRSLAQDAAAGGAESLPGRVAASLSMRRWSAPFMIVFAFTVTLAAIDWLMALAPGWYSTIFGVYVFAGMAVSCLSAVALATIALRASGRLDRRTVGDEHLANLGGLLFAFVCFYAYIGFSQYMLIWYANLPEESFYLVRRLSGGWLPVGVALAVVRFAVPFVVLLPRRAKGEPRVLAGVAVLMLAGQLLDLYWLIFPAYYQQGPALGWQELGPPALMIGLLLVRAAAFLGRHPAMAVGDPLLEQPARNVECPMSNVD